jgi:GT2 family glycosyltransferase
MTSYTDEPELSVVVLAWDGLEHTRRCVESVRRHTDIPYELVIVDNGSQPEARSFADSASDVAVLHDTNLGFAAGMNAGLAVARGRVVAFCNNDIRCPPQWAARLVATLDEHRGAGIVVPAVTSAANPRTVRTMPGGAAEMLDPFERPPSGVVYLMKRSLAQALGGWPEEYGVASAEDLDLCFTVWANGLEIVYDPSVLMYHVGKATTFAKVSDWRLLWNRNAQRFLDKWSATEPSIPRIVECPQQEWERNIRTARAVISWMSAYYNLRGKSFPGKHVARRVLTRVETSPIFRGRDLIRQRPSSIDEWERAVGIRTPL